MITRWRSVGTKEKGLNFINDGFNKLDHLLKSAKIFCFGYKYKIFFYLLFAPIVEDYCRIQEYRKFFMLLISKISYREDIKIIEKTMNNFLCILIKL